MMSRLSKHGRHLFAMKILLDKWVRIPHGKHQGKIFQLRYYNTLLHAAYFPGPPEAVSKAIELGYAIAQIKKILGEN